MAEISVDIHRTSYKGGTFLNKRWCYVGESNKVILVLSTTLIMLIDQRKEFKSRGFER